ncbi:KOW domain-containing protein [Peptoniphilus catoniae]|uniref:KOW domain-containing protein n=1 Tax=Peptoniphilus catoniae TaxID=1660341 RepID=UPI0010FED80E|nr:KOW domain-containing protein [Peptoniphilus catoniae]
MDKTFFIKVGQVVKSKAGRDAGTVFLVKEILDKSYVAIVDGKVRKLSKPKKKKLKHLIIYKDLIDIDKSDLNDSYIRKSLKDYS